MSINSMVIIILLGGWLAGKLFQKVRLPSILGMVLLGVSVSFFLKDKYPSLLIDAAPFLKSIALIIILLRAGLGISKSTLKKIGKTALLLSILPCLFEGFSLLLVAHFLFKFDWYIAGLTAFMLSAVSPAVIVPAMLDLKESSLGSKKEIPTLILAGASVDDVIAITLFSLFLSMAKLPADSMSHVSIKEILLQIGSIPLSIILGIIMGIVIGYLLSFFFKWRKETINSTEQTLIMIIIAVMMVQIGEHLHIAALLAVMTAGFILLNKQEKIAHQTSKKLAALWVAAEIILFVLIGMAVDPENAIKAGGKGLLLIGCGLSARSLGVIVSTIGSGLNKKERLFCVIAYWPKATVQAALGSIALDSHLPHGEEILSFAILAILVTAPLGLLGINLMGKKLLTSSE